MKLKIIRNTSGNAIWDKYVGRIVDGQVVSTRRSGEPHYYQIYLEGEGSTLWEAGEIQKMPSDSILTKT